MDERILRVAWNIILEINQILKALTVTPTKMPNGDLIPPSIEALETSRQRAVDLVAKIIETGLKWEPPPKE
jgi:hypothetical protein